MGRLLLVLAITAGLAFPGKAGGAFWSKRAPGKFLICEAPVLGISIKEPFVNSRYVIWVQKNNPSDIGNTLMSYDLVTRNTIPIASSKGLLETQGENSIYLGTSYCCWIKVEGGGPNAWVLQAGKVNEPTGKTLTQGRLPWKVSNIHDSYVTFTEVGTENIGSYVIDASSPTLEKTLLSSKTRTSKIPTVSHGKVSYEATNDDGKTDIFVYDIEKQISYKISDDDADNTNPIITSNFVYYEKAAKTAKTIICYNLCTRGSLEIPLDANWASAYLINNPDSDLLVMVLNNSKGKVKLACYDPLLNKTIDVTGEVEKKVNKHLGWTSGCCQGRRIIYGFGNDVMMAYVNERGEVATHIIDKGETKRTDIRVFCNTIVWREQDPKRKMFCIYGYTIE